MAEKTIYIPLCFYLYVCHDNVIHDDSPIYIPLCFYLYSNCRINGWSCLDLHSTMLLLILYAFVDILNGLLSFTFHYASTYTTTQQSTMTAVSSFTFHYASTYTTWIQTDAGVSVQFTFHYASTYTSRYNQFKE